MKKRYEVIIVGAGPAGLKCAETLIGSNLSVLLVERKKVIGDKPCAGGLTGLDKAFHIPDRLTRSFSRHTIFFENTLYRIKLAEPIRTIDRPVLGSYQLNKIKGSKNITLLKATVKEIEKDNIITDKGTFYFNYLVGADGSLSIVRKHLGLTARSCMGLCCNVEKVTDKFIWLFAPKNIKTGYIWEFPHKKATNVGIYFDPDLVSAIKAKELLKQYLDSKEYKYSEEDFRGAPICYDFKGCEFGNIFLAGDAAGLASKPTGEGMAFAMTSGEEIGRKIINPSYRMENLERMLKVKERQEEGLKIFESLPWLQKFFFKAIIRLMRDRHFEQFFEG